RVGQLARVGGDVGLLDRQFSVGVDLESVEFVELVVEVVEEEFLAGTGGPGHQDRGETEGGLLQQIVAPECNPVEKRRRNRVDELDNGLGGGAVADDVPQAVGGD